MNSHTEEFVAQLRKLVKKCTSADGGEYYPISDSLQPDILDALQDAADMLEAKQFPDGARNAIIEECAKAVKAESDRNDEEYASTFYGGFRKATEIIRGLKRHDAKTS